jgi:hypothetical protein
MRTGAIIVALAASLASLPAHGDVPDVSTQARSAMAVMQSNASRVRQLLLDTRRVGAPPAQVGCVGSALTRADVAVRQSRELYADMRAALVEGERGRAATILLSIYAYRESARSAARDADACVSPIVRVPLETTSVRLVVDKTLPPDSAVFR